jgi:hypothetical protein
LFLSGHQRRTWWRVPAFGNTLLSEWRELGANAIYIVRGAARVVVPGNGTCCGKSLKHKTRLIGMLRIIKLLLALVVVGFIGLTCYAYLADLAPDSREVKQPVILNVD